METYNTEKAVKDNIGRPASTHTWRKELEKFLDLSPNGYVLDLACGAGKNYSDLTPVKTYRSLPKHRYVGIDISDRMLRGAKTIAPRATLFLMNMHDLGFRADAFSGIWAPTCLFHIPKRTVRNVLQELRRVIRPEGIMFVTMHEQTLPGGERFVDAGRGPKFYAFYQLEQFSSILEDAGFTVLDAYRDDRNYQPPRDYTIWLCYFVRPNTM